MKLGIILGMVCLPVVAAMAEPAANPAGLKVGDKAPEFALHGSDDKDHALKDLKGKSWVVLAWFPKAFTGG
jgi:thioredoxin-dependent peroxiredoxin